MSLDTTYREMIDVAKKYREDDPTLAFMLMMMGQMEIDILAHSSGIENSKAIFGKAILGQGGYDVSSEPGYVHTALMMERKQYALWEFAGLLAVYLNNHHGEDIVW